MNDSLNKYFELQNQIYEAFGYQEQWRAFPMDDLRGQHWMLVGGDGVGATAVHSPVAFSAESIAQGSEIYGGPVYTQRHLEKWVFRTPTHALVLVDTQCDGNIFLVRLRLEARVHRRGPARLLFGALVKRRVVSGHELLTDGHRFWVNGPDGAAVARFSPTAGRDVHRPLSEQAAAGECLDCAADASFPAFAASVAKHYGVEIPASMWPKRGAAVGNRTRRLSLQGTATPSEQRRR